MKLVISALSASIIAIFLATPFPLATSVVHESVVQIHCDSYTGTAFFISPNRLLSAAHLAEKCGNEALYIEGDTIPLRVLPGKLDTTLDMVVLESAVAGTPIEIKKDTLRQGESLAIWGYPAPNLVLLVTKGVVIGFADTYTMTDARCYFGNSGGPAIDANGRFVGVLVALNRDTMMCYVTSQSLTRDFISDVI